MAKFTDKDEIKVFEKEQHEHHRKRSSKYKIVLVVVDRIFQTLKSEEEEHHAHFHQKEKWKRPKPKVNRQPTRFVKLGQCDWSDEESDQELRVVNYWVAISYTPIHYTFLAFWFLMFISYKVLPFSSYCQTVLNSKLGREKRWLWGVSSATYTYYWMQWW